MLTKEAVRERIEAELPGAEVTVEDLTGTGDHFRVQVVAGAFAGKSTLARHRLVYGTLRDVLDTGSMHALALSTHTPEEKGQEAHS